MPKPLDDEKIEAILDLWEEHEDVDKVAEEADVVLDTVRKYTRRAVKDGDERVDPDSASWLPDPPDDTAASRPGESPFRSGPGGEPVDDYTGMSPGEFLKDFFEDFEVGVKNQWVALQAKRADRRNKLPSKDAFISDLLNMKSGIAQSAYREATYIADEYWAQAQQYLGQTGRDISENPISGQMVNPHQQHQGPPPGTYDNDPAWVGPGQPAPMQPQAGQQDSLVQMLIQQQQQMMREFREALREQNQPDDTPETIQRELEKYRQLKGLVDDLQGEGAREISEVLDSHFASLQQQLAANAQGQQPAQAESLEEKLLTMAASNPEVSFEQVMEVIEQRGAISNDPEVLKKEYEKKIREAELEHESQRYERLGGIGERLSEQFGKAFGEAIVGQGTPPGQAGSNDVEAEADGGAASTDAAATPAVEPADAEPCPNCGADLQQGPNGSACPSCGFQIAQCDICTTPVDIPPRGEADHGYCPNCKSVIGLPAAPGGEATCDECDWAGERSEALAEAVECPGCENFRPITRPGASEADQLEIMEL